MPDIVSSTYYGEQFEAVEQCFKVIGFSLEVGRGGGSGLGWVDMLRYKWGSPPQLKEADPSPFPISCVINLSPPSLSHAITAFQLQDSPEINSV